MAKHKVAALSDVPKGKLHLVAIGREEIVLFRRGDEILAIGVDAQHLVAISSLSGDKEEVQADVSFLFGPFQTGVTRTFRVDPIGSASDVLRTATKDVIDLDPVPTTRIFTRDGTTPIGYIAFDTFIQPAKDQLRAAFASFRQDQVQDIVVDLRYNGGGLVEVAQLLGSLLADDLAGQPMFSYVFNANLGPDENRTIDFTHEGGIAGLRIAFITTDGTASASELVINSLEPYAEVAIVGAKTFGKPVGQGGFEMEGCDTVLRLIAFKTVNADGEGDYFGGLPDFGPGEPHHFSGDFCPAADDLSEERGDQDEASTASALFWVDQGTCPASAKALTASPSFAPRLDKPSLAQDAQPGLF